MPEASHRIAGLSEDRRRLLERLLKQNGTAGGSEGRGRAAASAIPPAVVPSTPLPGKQTFEQSSTSGEVKANYKRFYNAINSQLDASVFGQFSFFLNYGYRPDLNPQHSRIQLPDHFVNKNSVRLLFEVIGDCDLKDRRILDVGCGSGGTVVVIKQFFEARSVQGLDLSPNAIAYCRTSHQYDNVRFDEGDAEKLPFDPEQFDVVTNIESSHSYPNLGAFYAEVFRVLAPGGCFLYTDIVAKDAITE